MGRDDRLAGRPTTPSRMEHRAARHGSTGAARGGGDMAVVRNVHRDFHPNGCCFVCGKAAEVNPDRDHATGYRCHDCGRYDLVEKDRALFEAWIASADRRARLQLAVKFRWFAREAYDMRVFLDAEWLRKLTVDASLLLLSLLNTRRSSACISAPSRRGRVRCAPPCARKPADR